jgi:DNA-binding MarR family transcriptional regulator
MARRPKSEEQQELEALQAAQVDHLGVPLWRAARAYVALMMAGYRRLGYDDLTESHSGLLPHLDIGGTRITALAERAGLTKQAIGQMVTDLEALGYVSRAPDPNDARAKIVRYTAKGRRFVRDGQVIKQDLHARCGDIVGAAEFAAFAARLEHLADTLEEDEGGS